MTVTSPLGRFLVRYFWQFKLARPGKFLVASGLVSGAIGLSTELAPSYALFLTLFVLGVTALVANTLCRPRLSVTVSFPDRCVAGQVTGAMATVRNRGRRAAYDVSAGFPELTGPFRPASAEARLPVLPAGEAVSLPVRIRPLKRGFYPLPPLRAYSSFPLHVLRSGSAAARLSPLLALPSFHPLEGLEVEPVRRYQPGGFSLTASLGESPEYVGSRDYHPGDSVRRIDSRAWARLARPAVREYQEEYYCRIALVVDTHVGGGWFRAGRRATPELEAAISLTAAIADNLARGEYIIDLFAAGPELYTFRAGQSLAHLDNVLEILACLEGCRQNPFGTIAPALTEELGNIATLICVFMDWDESRRRLVRMAEETGCATRVVIVRDTPLSESLDEASGGRVTVHSAESVLRGEVVSL